MQRGWWVDATPLNFFSRKSTQYTHFFGSICQYHCVHPYQFWVPIPSNTAFLFNFCKSQKIKKGGFSSMLHGISTRLFNCKSIAALLEDITTAFNLRVVIETVKKVLPAYDFSRYTSVPFWCFPVVFLKLFVSYFVQPTVLKSQVSSMPYCIMQMI